MQLKDLSNKSVALYGLARETQALLQFAERTGQQFNRCRYLTPKRNVDPMKFAQGHLIKINLYIFMFWRSLFENLN